MKFILNKEGEIHLTDKANSQKVELHYSLNPAVKTAVEIIRFLSELDKEIITETYNTVRFDECTKSNIVVNSTIMSYHHNHPGISEGKSFKIIYRKGYMGGSPYFPASLKTEIKVEEIPFNWGDTQFYISPEKLEDITKMLYQYPKGWVENTPDKWIF